MEQKFITVKEAGKYLGYSPWTIYKWIQKGKIKTYSPNGHNVRIDINDVNSINKLKEHKAKTV